MRSPRTGTWVPDVYDVSDRFAETVTGSHRIAVRVQLLNSIQFGADPVGGVDLPLLSGQVEFDATADIKGSLTCSVPGEYWDAVQPYGAELHAARGIDYGDGTRELVPLGYFRIEDADQPDSPFGPVAVKAYDRTAALKQVRTIYPYQVPVSTSHRTLVDYLVNGVESGQGTYGMYPGAAGAAVPIDWTAAGYDPDAAVVASGITVDDYVYDFLAKLVDSRGAVISFRETGQMVIVARDRDPADLAVSTIRPGSGGTLLRQSRRTTRQGVYNIVRATGSDPAYQTGYRLAYINDPLNRLYWAGSFAPAVRYLASPLLRDSDGAAAGAQTMLARSTGLPTEVGVFAVPNPALQVFDKVNALSLDGHSITHIVDGIGIPLVGDGALELRTRTTNPVGEISNDPDPEPTPDPEDPDGDPGPGDPGGGPGGGPDPGDGTQAAVLNGWGAVIDGDEFNGATIDTTKWGLYDGPGHVGNGLRRPSAFSVVDGVGRIHGENGTTGGSAFRLGSYGYRVECRARCYNTGPGTDRFHPVLILWPDSDQWPAGAEYDFMECDEGDGVFQLFMHLPNHEPYRQDHYSEDLDIQNWHNYACEWNPVARTLRAWVDGRLVYNGSGRVAEAPGPMHLTWQLDHFGGDPRPANFDLSFVRIYAKPNA